jgi:alpha/beta superfamily hydrolase
MLPGAGVKTETVAGPGGRLEVLAEVPAGPPRALAVVCHPHPLHGGTLNNKVVHQLARAFRELHAVSVRFNFRGVGASEGDFDEGRGELQDLYSVVAWARERWPGLPLWLGGFSFGGFIALQAAASLQPVALVTVAPAVTWFGESRCDCAVQDWLVIQGSEDEVVPAGAVRAFIENLDPPPSLALLEGAGHFFHGRLNDLRQVVLDHFSGA